MMSLRATRGDAQTPCLSVFAFDDDDDHRHDDDGMHHKLCVVVQ